MPYSYFYGRVSHADSRNRKFLPSDELCKSTDHQWHMASRQRACDVDLGREPPPWAPCGYLADRDSAHETQDGRYIDQAFSAYRLRFAQRPAAGRLHLKLEKGDWLYLAYLDRGFRNWHDLAAMFDNWNKLGVRVIVCQPYIDSATWQGEMLVQLMGMLANMESRLKSERIRETFAALRSQGIAVHSVAQLGWKIVKVKGQKRYYPDDEARAIRMRVVELHDNQRLSFKKIADLLETELSAIEGRQFCPEYPQAGWEGRLWTKNLLVKLYRAVWIPAPSPLLPPGFVDIPPTQEEKRALLKASSQPRGTIVKDAEAARKQRRYDRWVKKQQKYFRLTAQRSAASARRTPT